MSERFQRVRKWFEHAIDLPQAERAAYLARVCEGDDAARREVEELLRCDDDGSGVADVLDRGAEVLAKGEQLGVGGRIATFRLCRVLGSGGMGTVYEAEQDEPRRRIALKVLSLGLASEQAVRRFRWEAEVLGRLRHPNIAQIHAVGVHTSGEIELPWFAMELVPGARDLLSYAKAAELTQLDRIELMLQVCEAVHHGHLQGVVHRDLKPQNVLVDDQGRVKVIDFGVARSMAREARAVTEGDYVMGTLHYMSPEQLHGRDVDTRSDIFSLGIVLYELLAGQRPFVFDDTSPMIVAETVSSQDAPRLSTVLHGVDRDLEVILQKALRREPGQRYATVQEFAEDLRAFLEERPVRARAPSTFYQLRMFARRRRGLVSALGVIVGLVITALVLVTTQNRELEARDRLLTRQNGELEERGAQLAAKNLELEREQRVASRLAKFAHDFLDESSLMETRGLDYTVREALDEAAGSLEHETFEDPVVEAELRVLIGETYTGLTVPEAAVRHLRRAELLYRDAGAGYEKSLASTCVSLAIALREQGRTDDAVEVIERGVAAYGEADEDDPVWWRVQHNRAYVMRHAGRLRDAEVLFRRVIAARERLLGHDDVATIVSMHNLGTLLLGLRSPEQARDVLSEAVARCERAGDHPRASMLQIKDNLAEAWRELGELDRAAALHRETMKEFEELVGPNHQITIGCGYHLLKVLFRQQNAAELETLSRDLLARCEVAFGVHDYRTMDVQSALAAALSMQGKHQDAVALQQRAYQTIREERGAKHPDSLNAGNNLVKACLAMEDHAAARQVSDELQSLLLDEQVVAQLPPPTVGIAWLLRAQALHAGGFAEQALAALARAERIFAVALPEQHALRVQAASLREQLDRR